MWLLNSLAQKSFPFLVIWRLLATGMVSNTCVRKHHVGNTGNGSDEHSGR